MTGHPRQAATAQLLVGAAIIGTNGLMVRLAEMAPTAVAFWRMLLAGLMLGALVLARHGWQPLSRKAWLWCLLPALAFAIDLWMWHRSILLVGPGLSTLLANAQVFFMALAGVLFFGERLTVRFVAGVLLAFFGLWLLLGGDWLEQSASGLARYLLIGYVIGALIVIALTLLYTWDKVLKLVLMLLGKLPHTPKWDERREKWANSLTELNREAKKVLLVPSIRVKGIAVSLVKLFVLYSIPYAALRLVGCTALNFAQAQLLASLMLLITSALPNVAGVGPMEFAFLLLFAPWADTAIASSALVLYRVATYFFPFLLSVIVFLREEKKSLKGFDAQSA